jgi:hypothetical protein
VDLEAIGDHDIALPQGRGELGLDPGLEGGAVHGAALDHPRGDERVIA